MMLVKTKNDINFKNLLRIFVIEHHDPDNKNDHHGMLAMTAAYSKMLLHLEPTLEYTNSLEGVPANRFLQYKIVFPAGCMETSWSAWQLAQILKKDFRTYHPTYGQPVPLKSVELDHWTVLGRKIPLTFENFLDLYATDEIKTLFIIEEPSELSKWLSAFGVRISLEDKRRSHMIIGINTESKEIFLP